jgi:hypothetical protein
VTTTLVEISRWHARQAKATTGADRDFHAEAAKLLRDLVKRRSEHRRNITAALAKRKAKASRWAAHGLIPRSKKPSRHHSGLAGRARSDGRSYQTRALTLARFMATISSLPAHGARRKAAVKCFEGETRGSSPAGHRMDFMLD